MKSTVFCCSKDSLWGDGKTSARHALLPGSFAYLHLTGARRTLAVSHQAFFVLLV